jgi:D-xylose reductase
VPETVERLEPRLFRPVHHAFSYVLIIGFGIRKLTFAAIALKYVDPAVRYPPGWYDDGVTPTDIKTSNATIRETWEAMEHLVDISLAHSLGISNFNVCVILDLLRYARIRPATLQIEHHPYLVQKPLIDFVKSEGITVTAYSSFGPTGYVEMNLEHAVQAPHLFQNQVINEIAKAHRKSAPQVLLRWSTQQGIAVVPKSDTLATLLENLDAKGFDLTDSEINKINGLNQNLRFNDPLMVSLRSPLKSIIDSSVVLWLSSNLQLNLKGLQTQ